MGIAHNGSAITGMSKGGILLTGVGYDGVDIAEPPVPPELWTPTDLLVTNKKWFDTNDSATRVESGGLVSDWFDKIGGVEKFTQPTASLQLATGVTSINGVNVFDSNNDWMKLNEVAGTYPDSMQITLIFQAVSSAASQLLIGRYAASDGDPATLDRVNDRLYAPNRLTPSSLIVNDVGDMLTPTILSMYADATNFGEWENSTLINEAAHGQLYTDSGIFTGLGFDGKSSTRSIVSRGDMVISEKLSTDDRQRLESFFAWKYGTQLNLDASNPYKSAPPTKVA